MALYFNTQRVQIISGLTLLVLTLLNCFLAVYVVGKIRQKTPIVVECDPRYVDGVGRYVDALERVKGRLK